MSPRQIITSSFNKFQDLVMFYSVHTIGICCIYLKFHLALHLAVQHGHSDVVRRLLSESDIDVFTLNNKWRKFLKIFLCLYFSFSRGMNCLHVLASCSRENTHLIFSTLLEFYPHFPLDVQDGQGNTGLTRVNLYLNW